MDPTGGRESEQLGSAWQLAGVKPQQGQLSRQLKGITTCTYIQIEETNFDLKFLFF